MPALLAPAKINLTLEVLARQADGYHTLRSLMVPIALYDRLDLEPAGEASFAVTGGGLEGNSENIVERALGAAGATEPLAVRLEKRIPVGGGLGGGSSDAAAVLRCAMSGAIAANSATDWVTAARSLGSDVPFFLLGTGALVEGTGERVTAIGALPPWWCVIVRPRVAVPTASAYRLLDDIRATSPAASRPRAASASLAAVDALQRGDLAATRAALVNDFHDPVLAAYPDVARAHGALVNAGGESALLSGSGSCLFALFERENEAAACAARLDRSALEDAFAVPFHHDPAWRAPR